MKTLFRCVLLLFILGCSVKANAQLSFMATDMVRIGDDEAWKYNKVECITSSKVTTITISMINNDIKEANWKGVEFSVVPSLGDNPKVYTYVFQEGGLTGNQVEEFIKGLVFIQTEKHTDKPQYVRINIDANQTNLPKVKDTKITAWLHPDGTMHYYMWVPSRNISYLDAYNNAKNSYFQSMRGYLPTITSLEETKLLSNISTIGGWSAGGRTPDDINDQMSISKPPTRENSTDKGKRFRWLCGPESGFEYYQGPGRGGPLNGASVFFGGNEPNDFDTGENVMQINFAGSPPETSWNDLNVTGYGYVHGYFIEFGGTDKEYKITNGKETATYPANPNYAKPDKATLINDPYWPGYNPGATGTSEATGRPRAMLSHVMVISTK